MKSPLNPFEQFRTWYEAAKIAQEPQLDVVSLATCGLNSQPSVRMVLFKDLSHDGFVFYTNYESRKAHELANNPRVAMTFYWHSQYRQIRIEGLAQKVSREESEQYFRTRPRGSQIGAWASAQSEILSERQILESRVSEFEKRFENQEIPCPPNWGGFRIIPHEVEFWQGQENRLHDRIRMRKTGTNWTAERLNP